MNFIVENPLIVVEVIASVLSLIILLALGRLQYGKGSYRLERAWVVTTQSLLVIAFFGFLALAAWSAESKYHLLALDWRTLSQQEPLAFGVGMVLGSILGIIVLVSSARSVISIVRGLFAGPLMTMAVLAEGVANALEAPEPSQEEVEKYEPMERKLTWYQRGARLSHVLANGSYQAASFGELTLDAVAFGVQRARGRLENLTSQAGGTVRSRAGNLSPRVREFWTKKKDAAILLAIQLVLLVVALLGGVVLLLRYIQAQIVAEGFADVMGTAGLRALVVLATLVAIHVGLWLLKVVGNPLHRMFLAVATRFDSKAASILEEQKRIQRVRHIKTKASLRTKLWFRPQKLVQRETGGLVREDPPSIPEEEEPESDPDAYVVSDINGTSENTLLVNLGDSWYRFNSPRSEEKQQAQLLTHALNLLTVKTVAEKRGVEEVESALLSAYQRVAANPQPEAWVDLNPDTGGVRVLTDGQPEGAKGEEALELPPEDVTPDKFSEVAAQVARRLVLRDWLHWFLTMPEKDESEEEESEGEKEYQEPTPLKGEKFKWQTDWWKVLNEYGPFRATLRGVKKYLQGREVVNLTLLEYQGSAINIEGAEEDEEIGELVLMMRTEYTGGRVRMKEGGLTRWNKGRKVSPKFAALFGKKKPVNLTAEEAEAFFYG